MKIRIRIATLLSFEMSRALKNLLVHKICDFISNDKQLFMLILKSYATSNNNHQGIHSNKRIGFCQTSFMLYDRTCEMSFKTAYTYAHKWLRLYMCVTVY